jgi:hypothetical protein
MSSIAKRRLSAGLDDRRDPQGGGIADAGSSRAARVWRPLFSTLIAVMTAVLLSGSVCIAVYCTEDCDPCLVQTCKCSTCKHSTANFESSHRLDVYDLGLVADAEDQVTRVYANILGLSLDRALGAPPHSADDLAKFARDVLTVNRELFPPGRRDARWILDGVERFGGSRVASFHASSRGELTHGAGELAIDGRELAIDGSELAIDGSDLAIDGRDLAIDGSDLAIDGGDLAIDGGDLAIDGGASISFLFDGRGNLVEIDHSLR